MTEPTVNALLTPEEWALVQDLRSLPESPLKGRVHQVLGEVLFHVRHPRCQGMGPEGFPCGDPRSACEECHRLWDILDGLHLRVCARD